MMGRGLYLQRRIDARYQQRGSQITLRRMSLLVGTSPLPNPPALKNVTVANDTAMGAVEIALAATVARGRLVAGDQLVMGLVTATVAPRDPNDLTLEDGEVVVTEGGSQITLTGNFSNYDLDALLADTPAIGNAFPQVLLTAPLSAAVSAGTPVNFIFAADMTVYGYIKSFSNQMIDGERVQVNDLNVGISAYSAGAPPPNVSDRLIIQGVEKSILNVQSMINDNKQLTWQCHVR
jgi:hypothetical protein